MYTCLFRLSPEPSPVNCNVACFVCFNMNSLLISFDNISDNKAHSAKRIGRVINYMSILRSDLV